MYNIVCGLAGGEDLYSRAEEELRCVGQQGVRRPSSCSSLPQLPILATQTDPHPPVAASAQVLEDSYDLRHRGKVRK